MLPDIMSKKESEISETERRHFSVVSTPPFTRPVTVTLIKTLAHKCASLSLSHRMMDYSSIFLVLLFGSCTNSTGDIGYFDFTIVLIWLFMLFLLLFLSQLLEKSGKMNKLQKPQRYSFPAVEWIQYVWLDLFYWHSKAIFCIFSLHLQTETYMQILCIPVTSVSPPSSGKPSFVINYTSPFR